ncbi:hypothetical protein AB595_14615 [Massilia sp. WF1]|nr:hypothetical protein AM586_08040 [Massilia sp. WG5]KLU36210.1 hypothetical protein AB595_14615 [Massilia sp. WF1]
MARHELTVAATVATMVGMGIDGGAAGAAWVAAIVVLMGSLIANERSLACVLATAKKRDLKRAGY